MGGVAAAGWPRAILVVCRRFLLSSLLLAAACSGDREVAGPAGPPLADTTVNTAAGKSRPVEDTVLEPTLGMSVERELAAGDEHHYTVLLVGGQVLDLLAYQQGVDLTLTVLAPDGAPHLTIDLVAGGRKHIQLTAATAGTHSLAVEGWEGSGSYGLRVEGLRQMTALDRKRATMERLFAEAEALRSRKDRESCLQAAERDRAALALALETGDRSRQAEILDHLGWIHRRYLEEIPPALDYYGRALALFETLGNDRRQSDVLNNIGRSHFELGEMREAVDTWTRALHLKRRVGHRAGEAATLSNLALASRYLGEVQQALTYYDRSLDLMKSVGARLDLGRTFNNRGRFYQALGEPRQALADLERALAIGRELGNRRLEAVVLTAIGKIYEERGELAAAQEALERALSLRIEVGARRGKAVTLRGLGSVYEKLGRAELALDADRQALAIFRGVEAPRDEAGTLEALGRLAAAAGHTLEASSYYREALAGFRQVGDPYGEIRTLEGLAASESSRGRQTAALQLMEEALAAVERVRRGAASHDLRASYLATHQDRYDFYIELLMELHRQKPAAGYDRRALAASERSRSRSLLELLTENRDTFRAGADPALLTRERELERKLDLVDRERLTLLDRGGAPAQAQAIEARLDELVREYRALRGQIRSISPRYAALTEPRTLSVEEIQRQVVDRDTLLLEYRLGRRRSYLWAVTTDSLTTYELPPRSEIEGAARRAYDLLKVSHRREFRVPTAIALKTLGRMLLGPVAEVLEDQRLLVAGDGALLYLPLGALPAPPYSATETRDEPLIARHEVVTIPSASALALQRVLLADRRPAPGLVAVVADPVFDASDPRLAQSRVLTPARAGALEDRTVTLSSAGEARLRRLPFARREAEAILGLADSALSLRALGFAATREVAASPELGRYRIVHFATHGELDAARPELSRLVFSRFDERGRPRDGSLFAHQVYDLDLPVELVVLSACETALGREVRGEGLVGLTRGFLHAGAERILVSLWPVEDRATAELMTHFYRSLLVDGQRPAAALRQAQLAIREETGWKAPYYWAGFVLQGEWR